MGPLVTTIDAYPWGTVVEFKSGEERDSIIEGFTITNGSASGVLVEDSHPTIRNNYITNSQNDTGGGIRSEIGHPLIQGNIITGNSANWGGGIGLQYSSKGTEIFGNIIECNYAFREGGGIHGWGCSGLIQGNIIRDNTAEPIGPDGVGGGVFSVWGREDFVNNIISGNVADRGSGIATFESTLFLWNNTIYGNLALKEGGGLYGDWFFGVYNSILWANTPDQILYSSAPTIGRGFSFNDVQGGWPGTGNIDADPLFVDPASNDFHLTWNSPCRNAGDNTAVTVPHDFEGDSRIALGRVDMGADEFYSHLYHIGDVIPGSPVDLKVVGYPTATVVLFLGSGIADPPYSTQHGDFWLNWPPLWQGAIGPVPGDGIKVLSTTVPFGWGSGSVHHLQALVGPWGGAYTLLTNPMSLTVE